MSKSINDVLTFGDREDYNGSPNWWRIHETELGFHEIHTSRRIISVNPRQLEDIQTGRAIAVRHSGQYLRLKPNGLFTILTFLGAITCGIAGRHATIPAEPELIVPEIVQRDLFGNEKVIRAERFPTELPDPKLPFDPETYLLSKEYAWELAHAAARENADPFTAMVPLPDGGEVPLNECHVYSEMSLRSIVDHAATMVAFAKHEMIMDAENVYDLVLDALRSGNDPLQVTMPTRFNMDKLITDFTIDGPETLDELMAEAQAQYDEETA